MSYNTCLDIMNGIESLHPSCVEFTFEQRAKWCDRIARSIYKDFGVEKSFDVLLTTDVTAFDMSLYSTGYEISNTRKIFVTCTNTTCSTDMNLETKYDEYEIQNVLDPTNPNTFKFNKYFPDERMMRVFYLAIPAPFPTSSGDSTTIPDIDPEALHLIEYGCISRICKAGNAPDVQLANQYELDYREESKRLKVVVRKRVRKMNDTPISYQEWNW